MKERREYKVVYIVGKGEIEIEWEREIEEGVEVKMRERKELTEKEDKVMRIMVDSKEHGIEELKEESGIESEAGVIAVIRGINRKIEESKLNRDIKKGRKRRIIEKEGYSRYKVECRIEVC